MKYPSLPGTHKESTKTKDNDLGMLWTSLKNPYMGFVTPRLLFEEKIGKHRSKFSNCHFRWILGALAKHSQGGS